MTKSFIFFRNPKKTFPFYTDFIPQQMDAGRRAGWARPRPKREQLSKTERLVVTLRQRHLSWNQERRTKLREPYPRACGRRLARRSQFRTVTVAPIKPQVLAWCYTPLTPSGRDLWWVSTNIDTDNPLLRNCPSLPPRGARRKGVRCKWPALTPEEASEKGVIYSTVVVIWQLMANPKAIIVLNGFSASAGWIVSLWRTGV